MRLARLSKVFSFLVVAVFVVSFLGSDRFHNQNNWETTGLFVLLAGPIAAISAIVASVKTRHCEWLAITASVGSVAALIALGWQASLFNNPF